jgi:hypothetical protein
MIFKVVPIRYENGWRLTDTHRAEQWAVAQFPKGRRMTILLRCATKVKAEEQLQPVQRAYEGISSYQLGKRMPKKETQA